MIPPEQVQQILDAADVVDVVGSFVSLQKRGANMIACCPFHNEKTPSFSVSPSKGIYKCFGCGKGGDAVRFVMDLEGFSYPEALKWLAKRYSIDIVEKEFTDDQLLAQNERESLFIVSEYAQKHFYETLMNSEEGESIGQSYFKERGYNKAIIEKFQLGYSLESWSSFTEKALKNGFTLPILEKAGLSIIKEGKDPIDRFRGRVMFPIHNVAGKPIAFGARILKIDPKAPKYLNSPETDIYHKSRIVYGIHHAKSAIRDLDNCYLVEGYTDVVSLHQAGIENVVASSGTSLTKEQIQLIRRFTTNITVLYDGDTAGIKASLRGTDIILEEGLNVKVVSFPDGEDPDSYVKKVGSEPFLSYITENQKDFVRFKTELSLAEIGDDPVQKANLISDIVGTISKIPDPIKRAIFFQETAGLLNIDEQILINEGGKLIRQKNADEKKSKRREDGGGYSNASQQPRDLLIDIPAETNYDSKKSIFYQEEVFVRDLVCHGNEVIDKDHETGEETTLADYLLNEIGEPDFVTPLFMKILIIYKENYDKGNKLSPQFFSSHQDTEIQEATVNWLSPRYVLSDKWEGFEIHVPKYTDKLDEFGFKNLLRIRKDRYEKKYDLLTEELGSTDSEEEQDKILDQMIKAKALITKMADLLGSVI
ncbi:DNA primase [Spirosomataceae bacterium TFI 002]|nr:DNA primase [Spirosomataceae bacterium TFI 002]